MKRVCDFRHFRAVVLLIIAPFSLPAQISTSADNSETATHAQRAQAAIHSNQPDVAIAELNALVHLDPTNANAWASLGMVRFTQGDYKEARSDFETALTHSPSLWNAKAFLGMCEIRLGQTGKGQADIESALEVVKDKTLRLQAELELVSAYVNSGLFELAAHQVDVLQREDPDDADVLYAAYRIHSSLASAALQQLSQSAPESARIRQVLGDDMLTQENYGRAVEEYREALKRNPHLVGAHLGIGQALLAENRIGNRAAAEEELRAELAIDDDNPDALFQLGQIEYERGDAAEAKASFEASLSFRPGFADARVALAKIFSDRNQDSEAVKQLEAALAAAPNNKTAHYRLAQLYKKSGETSKADEQFEIARRLQSSENHVLPLSVSSTAKQ